MTQRVDLGILDDSHLSLAALRSAISGFCQPMSGRDTMATGVEPSSRAMVVRWLRSLVNFDDRFAATAAANVDYIPYSFDESLQRFLDLHPFTFTYNVTGQPAISLPLNFNASGLPIGTQLVAAFGREDFLIQVAAQLEEAGPWTDSRPPICA